MLGILERYWDVIRQAPLVFVIWGVAAGSLGFWIRGVLHGAAVETQRERLSQKDDRIRELEDEARRLPVDSNTTERTDSLASLTTESPELAESYELPAVSVRPQIPEPAEQTNEGTAGEDEAAELDDEVEEVLLELAEKGDLQVDSIKRRFRIGEQRAIYLVEELVQFGLVWTDDIEVYSLTTVGINRDGRRYLAERGRLD